MGSIFDERLDAAQEESVVGGEEVVEEFSTPQVRRDALSLLRLGKIEDSFELYGHSFEMRTLNMDEELEADALLASIFASGFNEKAYKTVIVAAALTTHDGEPLARALGPEGVPLARRYDKVKRWYRPVIFKLYERYEGLEERQAAALAELENLDEPSLSMSEASSDSPTSKASSPGT